MLKRSSTEVIELIISIWEFNKSFIYLLIYIFIYLFSGAAQLPDSMGLDTEQCRGTAPNILEYTRLPGAEPGKRKSL